MILSNIIENGEPIGITDAGQDWFAREGDRLAVLLGVELARKVGVGRELDARR